MLAVMALNALVLLVLVAAGVFYAVRRGRRSRTRRTTVGRASPLPLRGRVCGQLVSPYPSGALSLRARLPFFKVPAPPPLPGPAPPSALPGIPDEPGVVRWRFAPTRSS